ncbi:glycosyltransferase family 2 protein [Algoriphagus lacus]|uniref:Glycosyltransferase family 2 protein n=1 Tax=Algoriphagus lacus TaxID=2056311 RepID=A0A418PLJ2_9BACT|nr:glycosyltransferase family A protein [Algoriphagus lacus]RIW12243.1 glycosyltransferase family 2 protein [Algoriphagus lacus]
MRTGVNPAKLNFKLEKRNHHRIIIPVFIPNFEGYFQEIFEVYKACIESAWLTQHNRSAITVVDNGSCPEVKAWLRLQQDLGKIETLITHSQNIGKVDAILGAARACREDLITLSDSDILFKNGWQEAVENVFVEFEQAGSVAPFPIARHLYYYSSSVMKAVIQKKLSFGFEKTEDQESIRKIYSCYGWDFKEEYDSNLPIVRSKKGMAVAGSGHQVMTIRREAIFQMPFNPSFIKISNNSEALWIDKPIDDFGYWRLSTPKAWVSHMGNHLTDENNNDFQTLVKNQTEVDLIQLNSLSPKRSNSLINRIYGKFFRKSYDHRGPAPKLKVQTEQDGL